MNAKLHRISVVGLLLAALFVLTACGTLDIAVEPGAEPTATEASVAPTAVTTPAVAPTEETPGTVWTALDAALKHIAEQTGRQYFPAPGSNWQVENVTAEGLVGGTTFQFTAGQVVATVAFPIVAPDATIFHVVLEDAAEGYRWEGDIDAQGQVMVEPAAGDGVAAVAWYGYVVGTREGAQYDDFLVLWPEGLGEIGLAGATTEVEAQIVALRDHEEPGKNAHFWGTLHCNVIDYGGCQLLVDRLRQDGPGEFFAPDIVDGWEGTIQSVVRDEPGSGADDYFVLAGEWPVEYGLGSPYESVADQIVALRDNGVTVRIWGELTAGLPDAGGVNIAVSRVEADAAAIGGVGVSYNYSNWQEYSNETLGYTLMHPGNTDIMGANHDQEVQFVGPIATNDHWPWFWVQHFDSEYYRPPAGTDVSEWVVGSGRFDGAPSEKMTIGDLPAVHLTFEASPQAYGRDEYYVIRGDQLYLITILHADGIQDWSLYDQFLASFDFLAG